VRNVAGLIARSGRNESRSVGEDDGLDSIPQIELLEDVGDVRLCRVIAHDELRGDLVARERVRGVLHALGKNQERFPRSEC
jgi:hypothetical protein